MDRTDRLTLEAFADHNMNVSRTANALYLHRNSLLYRLNVIHRETGLNPRRFRELVKLLEMEGLLHG